MNQLKDTQSPRWLQSYFQKYDQSRRHSSSRSPGMNGLTLQMLKQRFLKPILTLSCWYSLESSRRVLSNEYPCARVAVIFLGFLLHFVLANLAPSCRRVNLFYLHCFFLLLGPWFVENEAGGSKVLHESGASTA